MNGGAFKKRKAGLKGKKGSQNENKPKHSEEIPTVSIPSRERERERERLSVSETTDTVSIYSLFPSPHFFSAPSNNFLFNSRLIFLFLGPFSWPFWNSN